MLIFFQVKANVDLKKLKVSKLLTSYHKITYRGLTLGVNTKVDLAQYTPRSCGNVKDWWLGQQF